MEGKMNDPDFTGDIKALLRPETKYEVTAAYRLIKKELIEKI